MAMLSLLILPLAGLILLGWLVPLIIGLCRSRGARGRMALITTGAVWGVLAVGIVVAAAVSFTRAMRMHDMLPEQLSADNYAGPKGTIAVQHDGPVSIMAHSAGDDGAPRRWSLQGTNGTVVAPAARLTIDAVSCMAGSNDAVWTAMTWLDSRENEFTLAPTQTVALLVGPPFKATVTAKRQRDGRMALDLRLVDLADHSFSISGPAGHRDSPGFEAVSPSGDVFWRGKFEYG